MKQFNKKLGSLGYQRVIEEADKNSETYIRYDGRIQKTICIKYGGRDRWVAIKEIDLSDKKAIERSIVLDLDAKELDAIWEFFSAKEFFSNTRWLSRLKKYQRTKGKKING